VNTRALLAKLHPNRGRVVELGSGMGLMLDRLRDKGWSVLGVDPDRNTCRHASRQLGIEAIPATLEEAALPDESAEVMMMLRVIEHVPDPVATLREIHRILAPGGHLVIETPRYDTWTFKLLGRRERSVSCEGHIYFFTTDSLRKVYEAAGFETVRYDAVGRSLTLDRLANNLGVVTRSPAVRRFVANLSKKLGLENRYMHLNFRDMQRVVVRKV
jgi:SAM-dependent methyltransferase